MRNILIVLCLLALLPMRVAAVDVTAELETLYGTEDLTDGLTGEQRELLDETDKSDNFFSGVQRMISKAVLHGGGYVQEAARSGAMVLGICLLCGLCGLSGKTTQGVRIAGVLAICGVYISNVESLIQIGADAVQEISAYGMLLLPVLNAAAISAGSATGAPMIYGLTVLFSDFLLVFFSRLLLPMLYVLLGLAVADCISTSISFKRIRELVTWLVRTGLKTVLYVYFGFLTVTQVISGTADAMSVKAAKLTISSMIPVVGSIVSDASETLLVGASMIKNTVGTVGMLSVFAICILPFLRLGIHFLMLKLTAAVSGITAPPVLVSMIDGVADTVSLLLGILGSAVLVLFLSIVCSMKAVGYG